MYEPMEFKWMENSLVVKDIEDSHRFNYLRHRLWVKEIEKSKES